MLLFFVSLVSCDSIDSGGGIALGTIAAIIGGIILLGWLAFKVIGSMVEIGFWGIVVIILLIVGFIAFIVIKSMGT